jgi:ANTAR domain
VSAEDLGYEAAGLLSLVAAGEARALNKLAQIAVSQVPGCAAANASIWRDGEMTAMAATHPDSAWLTEFQLAAGAGPLIGAANAKTTVSCPDVLTETRWPGFAGEALRRGVRCSVHLVGESPPLTLVISLFGVRAGVLDAASAPMARMLAVFGQAALVSTVVYDQTQRTASQLRDAVGARAVVDQAKGILMHALGCDADRALDYLRRESQRRHVKVTEVAAQVLATHTAESGR